MREYASNGVTNSLKLFCFASLELRWLPFKISIAIFKLLEQSPYSPDLALSDLYLVPQLKERFRGHKFGDDDGVVVGVGAVVPVYDFFKESGRRFAGSYSLSLFIKLP